MPSLVFPCPPPSLFHCFFPSSSVMPSPGLYLAPTCTQSYFILLLPYLPLFQSFLPLHPSLCLSTTTSLIILCLTLILSSSINHDLLHYSLSISNPTRELMSEHDQAGASFSCGFDQGQTTRDSGTFSPTSSMSSSLSCDANISNSGIGGQAKEAERTEARERMGDRKDNCEHQVFPSASSGTPRAFD